MGALVTVSQVNAEYIWTGTEWKWQDPDSSDSVALDTIDTPDDTETDILDTDSEGSGNVDTWDDGEDYDDDYDYDLDYRNTKQNNKKEKKEKKKKDKKDRQKNRDFYPSNSNSAILPASDDEDFFDGSGDTDGFVSPQNNFNFNNNNNNYQYNTESPISSSNNNNQNEYREEDDEYDYDEDYEYDNYDPIQNNVNNVDPTNGFQDNYNPNPTPSTTVRSSTTKRTTITTTTKRPNAGSEHDENTRIRVNRPASFFAQPGILAAVIGGAVVGLLCAILLVMFIVYRMRKKDEGSYALDEPKRSHNVNSYSKPPNREFYA